MTRHDGRAADQLREIHIERPYYGAAPGRLLIRAGRTTILCSASISNDLPPWKLQQETPTGWVTAEYNMLPGCTSPRKTRRTDGRATEIQRLIGRSLRSVVDFVALGPRQVTVDCDVLEADGGTRTLSITGGFIALVDALAAIEDPGFDHRCVFRDSVAAISVGIAGGTPVLDLDYMEDSRAEVDMNVVMTGGGAFIEVQGTAERQVFDRQQLNAQLDLASAGIAQLTSLQQNTLGEKWPLDRNFQR
jgi:ribonuclease PH